MIVGFKDKRLEALMNGKAPKRIPAELVRKTRDMLTFMAADTKLDDLRSPPGNRLEALAGDRAGQHSVRINRQYRLCFVWDGSNFDEVELVDYH